MLLAMLFGCDPADSEDVTELSGGSSWWHPAFFADRLISIDDRMDFGEVLADGAVRHSTMLDGCSVQQTERDGWAAASADLADALDAGENEFCAAVPNYLQAMIDVMTPTESGDAETINVGIECPSDSVATDCLTDGEFSFATEDEEAYGTIRRGVGISVWTARLELWDADLCAYSSPISDPEGDDAAVVDGTITVDPFETEGQMDVSIEAGTMDYTDWSAAMAAGNSVEATDDLTARFTAAYCEMPDVHVLAI